MRTFIVGDIHNKWNTVHEALQKTIQENGDPDKVIFLGDLVNDWDSTPQDEIQSMIGFADWVFEHRADGLDVQVLMGNHDMPYLMKDTDPLYPRIAHKHGFQPAAYRKVHQIMSKLGMIAAVQMHDLDGTPVVISHAGFSQEWLYLNFRETEFSPETVEYTNELLQKGSWANFNMVGAERGGTSFTSSPVWCGMHELTMNTPHGIHQIVGHTPVRNITTVETNDSTLVFCDTFSTYSSGQFIGDCSILVTEEFS